MTALVPRDLVIRLVNRSAGFRKTSYWTVWGELLNGFEEQSNHAVRRMAHNKCMTEWDYLEENGLVADLLAFAQKTLKLPVGENQ